MKLQQLSLQSSEPLIDPSDVIPNSNGLSPTEERNPASSRLSTMRLDHSIQLMIQEEVQALQQISNQTAKLESLILRAVDCISSGGRVFYIGAGTSGRLAAIDAAECHSTFDSSTDSIIGLLAGGDQAMYQAMDEAEQTFDSGLADVKKHCVTCRDLVIGISASGQTPYTMGGLSFAKSLGTFVALITFNPYLEFKSLTPDLVISFYVGPEVLTGSTRLKCGTATKCILNILSTLTMVKLGKSYDNLMIDLNPGNSKLKERLARIVCSILPEVDAMHAMQSLIEHDFDVRKVIQSLVRETEKENKLQ